jgi:beta-lactamase class A
MNSLLSLILTAATVCSPAGLRAQMRRIAAQAGPRAGAAALIVETGEFASWNRAQHFPMQSVYKMPIVMAILRRVDEGRLSLDRKVAIEPEDLTPSGIHSPIREKYPHGGIELTVRELARGAIVDSDGTASDVLLKIASEREVTAFMRQLGVSDLVVATSEKEMAQGDLVQYRNWATPEATVRLLVLLQTGKALSRTSSALLLGWMTESTPGPHRIKGLLPEGTPVAHKTGTSGTVSGLTQATNDVGLITLPNGHHLAVAVFVSDSRRSESVREGVIAKIARAAWDCWGRQSPQITQNRPSQVPRQAFFW